MSTARRISPSPEDLVAEARDWVGTPYRHQGRLKGVAADCAGLVIGVASALGIDVEAPRNYSRVANPTDLLEYVGSYCCRVSASPEDATPGDILLLSWRAGPGQQPRHIGIRAEVRGRATIIHAHASAGKCVEHGLTGEWYDSVRAVYRPHALEG